LIEEVKKMTGTTRRQNILNELKEAKGPLNATKLAEMNGVTRQIIVADIALLRASGNSIRAEHKGYVLDKDDGDLKKKIVCRHTMDNVSDELYAVVDNGGKVLDIQVEHSLYGTISADLSISSRYDADEFIRESKEKAAAPLADLTGGIHIHTISVKDEQTFERICKKLTELGILISD
jgi:transcriptional regulator of NAD metabolism